MYHESLVKCPTRYTGWVGLNALIIGEKLEFHRTKPWGHLMYGYLLGFMVTGGLIRYMNIKHAISVALNSMLLRTLIYSTIYVRRTYICIYIIF